MCEWINWGSNNASLDTLAKVFGFPSSKGEMDGSQVWPAYQEKRLDDIYDYCLRDVELNRKIYYKMIVDKSPYDQIQEPIQDDIPF
jgi:predicted PolB exonuclease-like 3'-5' exonuclease